MSEKTPAIVFAAGALAGQRFEVPASGLRLGRSSHCELAVADPALSRIHCLFEVRNGALWVTDLKSANGTSVNGEALGEEARALAAGDEVVAGETVLRVESAGSATIDLGLGGGGGDAPPEEERPRSAPLRLLVWAVALLSVVGAAALILSSGRGKPPVAEQRPLAQEKPALLHLAFEKVEADPKGIYRYALEMDSKGLMTVEIDDVPKENRHVKKATQLTTNALEALSAVFASPALYRLAPEYAGEPTSPGSLRSLSLRVVRGGRVFSTTIENAPEPEEFRSVREQLETFSKNELGIWAIQFSAEKLVEMSAELRREGDAKWEERDVQYGNIAAALAAYNEAVFYLDTVNPKPETYGALVNRQKEVEAELDKRYRDQRFRADRAINLADWRTAEQELRVLCQMVPDAKDPRHSEAASKLLDVENRMKKGLK